MENEECVKETATLPESRKKAEVTNGSSTQRENPAPGAGLQLAPQSKCKLVQ